MADFSSTIAGRAQAYLSDKRRAGTVAGRLISDLLQAYADAANRDLTTCGDHSRALAHDRALRVVERHGWPIGRDGLEWLSHVADEAGTTFNTAARDRDIADGEVPF